MTQRIAHYLLVVVLGTLALVNTSCVAFRGVGLDDVEEERYGAFANKLAINFTNRSVMRGERGRESASEAKPVVEGHMLSGSGLFLTTQSIAGEEDLHLRFKTVGLASDESLLRQIPMGLYLTVSLATLGIIPYFESLPRRLEVEVMRGNAVVRRYRYEDYVLLISSLLVLPWWRYPVEDERWYDTKEMTRQVDHNIVKTFLKDFYRDFMRPRPKPTQPSPKAPAKKPSPK